MNYETTLEKDLAILFLQLYAQDLEYEIQKLTYDLISERLKHPYDNTIDLSKIDWSFKVPSTCPKCGIRLDTTLGYVCSNLDCPTGLGGVRSSTPI